MIMGKLGSYGQLICHIKLYQDNICPLLLAINFYDYFLYDLILNLKPKKIFRLALLSGFHLLIFFNFGKYTINMGKSVKII